MELKIYISFQDYISNRCDFERAVVKLLKRYNASITDGDFITLNMVANDEC